MQELFGEYAVEYAAAKVGTLAVSQHGLVARFSCQCVVETKEILRLAVRSGEHNVVLGVMMPDGDKLRFCKKYSRRDLSLKGLIRIDGCRLVSERDNLEVQPMPEPKSQPKPIPKPQPKPIPKPQPEPMPKPQPEPMPKPQPKPTPKPIPTPPIPKPKPKPIPIPAPMPKPMPAPIPAPMPESIARIVPKLPLEDSDRSFSPPYSDSGFLDIAPYAQKPPAPQEKQAPPPPPPSPQTPEQGWMPVANVSAPLTPKVSTDADEGWQAIANPSELFADPELKIAASEVKKALSRTQADTVELAIPFEIGRPFPLMPIFCLGRLVMIGETSYLIFKLKNGNLAG